MDEIPRNRTEAQVLANRVGVAYYADFYTPGRKPVYCVTRDTPIKEPGEHLVSGNAWSRLELEDVIKALNNAYQRGLRSRIKSQVTSPIRDQIDEAFRPLADRLEQHLTGTVPKKS